MTQEQKDFVVNLSTEMKTQANHGLGKAAYAVALREQYDQIVPDTHSTTLLCVWDEEEYYEEDWGKFISDLKEKNDYYNIPTTSIKFNNILSIEKYGSFYELQNNTLWTCMDINIVHILQEQRIRERSANFFLTNKACNQHIAENKHNLNSPDGYPMYLNRNTEIESLIHLIHTLADDIKEGT